MVEFPFASLSAFVIGAGVSFAALNAAVKTTVFGCPDGDDGLLLPQPAASTANPTSTYRFMLFVSILRIRICA